MAAGQLFDNFEGGLSKDWVQSVPQRWSADTAGALAGRYSLHHIFDNPVAGTDRIGIPVVDLHADEGITSWMFTVRHGYDPSSSNNWSVFLLSDTGPSSMSAGGSTNGFALGVNLTGYDDTLRLWKVKGTNLSVVVNCHINWQNDIGISSPVKISVERDSAGCWTVNLYRKDGSPVSSDSGIEPELFESLWFGILYNYSSTRDRLLWIDDIKMQGVFYSDTTAPHIISHTLAGKRSIEITLDERPADHFGDIDNFYLGPGYIKPSVVRQKSDITYIMDFDDEFINKSENTLIIRRLCDQIDNCLVDRVIHFTPVWVERGDVIISEILADPLPAVSLPAKEFIELTNRSSFAFSTEGWKLIAGAEVISIPPFIAGADEISILCSVQDTALYSKFGAVMGMRQFPALNDDGKLLCITDSSGIMIHGVEYSDSWYGNELKSEGGWSLEMIDISFPFYFKGNWRASASRTGGTPGVANSVSGKNPDLSFYGIVNAFVEEKDVLFIILSEPLPDYGRLRESEIVGGPDIDEVTVSDLLLREFRIKLNSELREGNIYKVKLPETLIDFAGNRIERSVFDFGLPAAAAGGDLLFNELLFNPFPGDPDFIEFYNCSGKILDASRLWLISINEQTNDTSSMIPLSRIRRYIMPGSYYAITTDREKLLNRYYSSAAEYVFEISSLPSMPDDKGTLILLSSELDIIDRISYSEKMQHPLLAGFEGITLEKTGKCNLSGDAVNWHSAAENFGWGSPGTQNSIFTEIIPQSDQIAFSSTKITPDNDGFEDYLSINLTAAIQGNIVSVLIFNENGNMERRIALNVLTGIQSTFIWDGTADDGSPVASGIYIVLVNWYDEKGRTERMKRVCTVLR